MKIGAKKIIVNKKIVSIALLILMLTIIGSVSYAYFTASVIGNETAENVEVDTGTMNLVFDGTSIVGLSDALPGATHTINFSVENTGTLATTYAISLIDVVNTFYEGDPNDLVYTITSTNDGGFRNEAVVPQENGPLISAVIIEPKVKHNYTMKIHFKETGDNQNDNQGKVFSGKVQINTLSNSNYLALKTVDPNKILPQGWDIEYEDYLRQTYHINEVTTSDQINIFPLWENYNDTAYVAEDYTINYYNGSLSLENPIEVTSFEGYEGWYIFDVDSIGIYRIKTVASGTDSEGNYSEVTEVLGYTTMYYNEENEGQLMVSEDADGKTYVNNGAVANNYVEFANQLWRIVRVNGDGTIRLIKNTGGSMSSNFGSSGYTTANSHACTVENPCYKNDGTSNAIKTYLEDWYDKNLATFDDKIALSGFCNDTSGEASNRIVNNRTEDLTCSNITTTDGGYYKLKIGLLTADEMTLGGLSWDNSQITSSHYLYRLDPVWWTLTPYNATQTFSSSNYLFFTGNNLSAGIYPVINLKSNTEIISGNGTADSPYQVS